MNKPDTYPPYISKKFTRAAITVCGYPIKAVSSNVRRLDISWNQCTIKSGVGKEGNLVLLEVNSENGSRKYIENQDGINVRLYEGDYFIGVLANRHSGTEESGDVPEKGISIKKGTTLHQLSTSGLIGINTSIPPTMVQIPRFLKAYGLVCLKGKPIDLIDFCADTKLEVPPLAPIILICGTSSEIGKTTSAVSFIREASKLNFKVAGAKLTGTGNMQDELALRDSGAQVWLEFPDVGLPCTYTSKERFQKATYKLMQLIQSQFPDLIILEAGGDPIEANVPTFLSDVKIMRYVKAIVIVSGDVMGLMGASSYVKLFAPNIPIYCSDPKGRNAYSNRLRTKAMLPDHIAFDPFSQKEVSKVIRRIMDK